MLVSLMRAMKPKILESFKQSNAQKEFLSKLSKGKVFTVVLSVKENTLNQFDIPVHKVLQNNKTILVYNFSKEQKKV